MCEPVCVCVCACMFTFLISLNMQTTIYDVQITPQNKEKIMRVNSMHAGVKRDFPE